MEHDKSSCSESAGTSDGDTALPVAAQGTMTGKALRSEWLCREAGDLCSQLRHITGC